jgi:thiamine-monophosphate kinase
MASAEFALIHRYFDRPQQGVPLAVGDDCALLQATAGQQLAISTDTLVCGVHFFPDVEPAALGHKALAVNLSDLAAMGATPRWFTLAITLPQIDEPWLAEFARGLHALSDAANIRLVGGDTTRGPLSLTLTVLGEVPSGQALRRDAARAEDEIWVSGTLGDAAMALKLLREQGTRADIDACLRACLERPSPRLALGEALRGVAHAAIDISDGLLADLGHICERSGLAATVQLALLPLSDEFRNAAGTELPWPLVWAGGDDYELCFTAPMSAREAVLAAGRVAGVPVTCIGRMLAGQGVQVVDAGGNPVRIAQAGFDHFQSP